MSFNTVPAYYRNCSFPVRNGVFYAGGTAPSVTLSGSGATAYEVRDYYGTIVSSGSMSGTTCTPAAPTGGWRPGWYRIYFTQASFDSVVGYACAATMFSVIRSDSRFPAFPASTSITAYANEAAEPVAKGIMGLGSSRVLVPDYGTIDQSQPGTGYAIPVGQAQIAAAKTYWSSPASQYADPDRPARRLWCSTPGACADSLTIAGSSSGIFLTTYVADPSVDGSQVYVAAAAGSTSGTKITVRYPDSSTIAETYDNLASSTAATTAINAASAYIKAFNGFQTLAASTSATAIGRAKWNGIVTGVQAFYPDVTRFEFTNEPGMTAETGHQMRLFQAAVHAGNASAKAIGPCTVYIPTPWLDTWPGFAYCDEISFHDYNSMTNGNLAMGRAQIEAFTAKLAANGLASKPLWQTEAGAAATGVYGVHHPRRARVKILHTLLWEQYGVPRERNVYWYDISHGFWDVPAFWQHADSSLTADAALHRVLAEETFGMTHASRMSFGHLGDAVYLGSIYAGATASVAVLMASSYVPGSVVTLSITGTASPLTVVDSFGNTTTAAPDSSGRITVPVLETPAYVRLPAGVSATVYRMNAWPPLGDEAKWPTEAPLAALAGTSASSPAPVADNQWMTDFSASGVYQSAKSFPDTLTMTWPSAARADRVIVWAGMSWQWCSTLVDFDIQTSNDGATWTTRGTVTKTGVASFLFGTNSGNTWCTQETYWDEQWIFDVPFPAGPVTFKYLRLYVRSVSSGGEPDAAALAAGGQGDPTPMVVLQEVAVLCDANTRPAYVRA